MCRNLIILLIKQLRPFPTLWRENNKKEWNPSPQTIFSLDSFFRQRYLKFIHQVSFFFYFSQINFHKYLLGGRLLRWRKSGKVLYVILLTALKSFEKWIKISQIDKEVMMREMERRFKFYSLFQTKSGWKTSKAKGSLLMFTLRPSWNAISVWTITKLFVYADCWLVCNQNFIA